MTAFVADEPIEFRSVWGASWAPGKYLRPDGDVKGEWHWVESPAGEKRCVPLARIRKQPPVLRICPSSKPRHDTADAARSAAITAGRRASMQLSYFHCGECAGYHLTKRIGDDNPEIPELSHLRRWS
jgi:hypothetical protein